MKQLFQNRFIRRLISCLLIISFLVTGMSFPTPAMAKTAGNSRISLFSVPENDILGFSVTGQSKAAVIDTTNHEVYFYVPDNIGTTNFQPTISVPAGATVAPASGAWQDFTDPVVYTVTSADDVDQTWTVMRMVQNTTAEMHDFSVPAMNLIPGNISLINHDAHTIQFVVPSNTNVTALVPNFGLSPGATASPAVKEACDFSSPVTYTITAEAGNTQTWTVTCLKSTTQYEYQVKHYLQDLTGSGYTLSDTIAYSDLQGAAVTAEPREYYGFTEKTDHPDRVASGSVTDTGTLVMKLYYDRNLYNLQFVENGGSTVEDINNIRYDSVFSPPLDPTRTDYVFDGWYTDEALTQEYDFSNPVTESHILYAKWIYDAFTVSYRMPDESLLLSENYINGTVFTRPADPVITGKSLMGWYLEPTFTTPYLFDQPLTADKSLYAKYLFSGKDVLSVYVPGQTVVGTTVNTSNHSFTFHMPFGSDVSALTPMFNISEGASISPISGSTQDFGSPVTYTVTAENGGQQTWTANCIVDFNPANAITAFTVPGQSGTSLIDSSAHTVTFSVPYGTNLTALTPTVTISPDATVSPLSQAAVDFSGQQHMVAYNVTAQNGELVQWRVYCTVLPNTQNGITGFTVNGQLATSQIDAVNHTVEFQMPYDTDVSALRPVITLNAQASSQPASGQAVDFRQPIQYTVTAGNGAGQVWTIRCIQINTANDITAFTVPDQYGSADIDKYNHTVHFYLKEGTQTAALAPTITISEGADIYPESGAARDFNGTVTYQITAQDGSPQVWTVTYSYYHPVVNIATPTPAPIQEEKQTEIVKEDLEEAIADTKTEQVEARTGGAAVTGPNSATLNGTLVAGGGSQIQTGFRYREATAEQWSYVSAQSGNLSNGQSFSADIKGLKPGTTYIFEGRASNGNGLSNGGGVSFLTEKAEKPTVVTNAAATGTLASMLLTGAVTKDGGDAIQDAGFLWGDSEGNLKKVSLGAVKSFSTELKQLVIGKTYYYQAYADNSSGTGLGKLLTYTIPGLAVTTLEAVEITEKGAILQGRVTGKDKLVECGFTISPGKQGVIIAKADEKGYFKVQIDNLLPDKVYYFTAYAKTESKTFYGKSRKLTPLNSIPKVDTKEVTDVGQIWAQLGGLIHKNDGTEDTSGTANKSGDNINSSALDIKDGDGSATEEDPILECGFYWGEDQDTKMQVIIEHEGELLDPAHKLVGLQAGTTYYYKAYAKNKKGIGYGEIVSFTTAEPTKPVVATRFAGYDSKRKQWIMAGAITNKGGIPLSEYGFMISNDGVTWTELPVGFDTSGNFVALDLPFISQLNSGTYYVKAYALNKTGKGEGVSFPFVIPMLPSVEADARPESPTPGTYVLKGRITGTGAEGFTCQNTRFKYRKKGDKDWNTVGLSNGDFGVSEYSFTLTGLIPGTTYEYLTEAENITGLSSSKTVEFTADYGKDAKQAAEYLINSGAKPADIVNIMKVKYAYSLEAAAQLLLSYGYTDEVMGTAIKNSDYKPTYQAAAQLFKKLDFTALASARILSNNYDLRDSTGATDRPLVKVLKENQYTPGDIAKAIVTLYSYDVARMISLLRSGSIYSDVDAYSGTIAVFGQDAVLDYIWAQSMENKRQNWWLTDEQILREFTIKMRDNCKLDADAVADQLIKRYPQLDLKLAAKLFADTKYPLDKTIIALNRLFGAEDVKLAKALDDASFKQEDIIRYLIQEAKLTAEQMVPILTYAIRWKDPKEACTQVLRDYYKLDAVGAAKAMYAGGWIETVDDKTGYGIGQLLTALEYNYNQRSMYSKMLILKEIGQSPLAIALRIAGPANWVKDYKALGFTASDVALWYRECPDEKKYGLSAQLRRTVQFSSEAGYELTDIALALRTIFSLDMDTAFTYMRDYSKKPTAQINQALKTAYGENPLLRAVRAMSGNPVRQVANALKNTYNITAPEEAAGYLLESGYTSGMVLEGMCGYYYECRNASGFQDFLKFAKKALPDSTLVEALNAVIIRYGNTPEPYHVIGTLNRFGYDYVTTADILNKDYHYTLQEALDGMLDNFGRLKEAEYTAAVLSAYGLNTVSYIEYEKMNGTAAAKSADLLMNVFGIKAAAEVAGLLAKGGYSKEEVSTVILEKFYQNTLSEDSVDQINQILVLYYPEVAEDKIGLLLKNGQVKPVSRAIGVLLQAGYPLESVIKAIKQVYSLSDEKIISELNTMKQFSYDEITIAAQGALGNNYLIMMINQWRKTPWGNPEGIWREMEYQLGITDPAVIFRYMRYTGFSESETVDAAFRNIREGVIPLLKTVYDVKSAEGMGELLAPFGKEGPLYIYHENFSKQLKMLFPETTTYDIARALKAYGYPTDSGSGDMIDWLRGYASDGKHDDKLAAFLGKNNGGLDVKVWYAAETLKAKGYVVQDAAFWLLQCGYTWEEFFPELVHLYAPKDYPTSYYDNNSSSKFIVGYLKEYYDIKDIARGDYSYWGHSGGVLADLISGGYTLEQSVYATLWLGKSAASDMVIGIVDNSISRANAAHNQSLRLNAVQAATMVFDISLAVAYDKKQAGLTDYNIISLQDIATCLVKYGPSSNRGSFSSWEVLAAMQAVAGRYIELTNSGLPSRELALATLRLAGASASDGAAMLAAHNVGLSTTSIIKSIFGVGSDWIEAVKALAGAGYSFSDSISAVYNNSSYKTVIGIGILGSITSSAIGQLSSNAQLSTYISLAKEGAKLGFKIGEGTITLDDVMKYNVEYWQYKYGKMIYNYIPSDYKPFN